MESTFRATLFLILVTASASQNGCICRTNKRTICASNQNTNNCECTALGSGQRVNCSTLTSKCLLMKAEMAPSRGRRFQKPEGAFLDNDGLYNPDCDDKGNFKARQCNQTETCWCVNSAGVRRTDKGNNVKCSELVRTNWIFINLKHKEREATFSERELKDSLRQFIHKRYMLHQNYITAIDYDPPFIHIDLKQNATQKLYGDVDIADVAYYFEKDIKGDSVFHQSMFNLSVNEEPLDIEKVLIYYVDEKLPEFSMKRLAPGIIAVVVVVILAIIIGIIVLVITRRRSSGKYKKVEIKEMGEMRRENS